MLRFSWFLLPWLAVAATACGTGSHAHHDGDGADASDAGGGEAAGGGGAACTPSGIAESDATSKVTAASVTIEATLLNALAHCPKGEIALRLALDTHSGDLTQIDLAASARIETSLGDARDEGFAWVPESEGAHSRRGKLVTATLPLVGASWLRLTLRGIAGSDRVFEWTDRFLAHDQP